MKLVRLGNIFEFKNGFNADKFAYGSGTPFVNVMDIFGSRILHAAELRGAVNLSPKQFKDFGLRKGDILLNRTSESPEEIACASVYDDDSPAVFGGFVIRARPLDHSIAEALRPYILQSSAFRRQAIKFSQGVVRGNIGQSSLSRIKIPLPPLPTQRRIAAVLQTWDRAIALAERQLQLLRDRKRGLMQFLLTGEKRLPGFEGEWEEVRLGDIADIVGGGTPSRTVEEFWNGAIPWLSPGDLLQQNHECVDFDHETISGIGLSSSSATLVPSQSIIVTTRASIGYIVHSDKPVAFSQGFVAAIPKPSVLAKYLYWLLSTKRNDFLRRASGNTFLEISRSEFAATRMRLPKTSEQSAIALALDTLSMQGAAQVDQIENLQLQKKGLMQRLLDDPQPLGPEFDKFVEADTSQ